MGNGNCDALMNGVAGRADAVVDDPCNPISLNPEPKTLNFT